MDAHLEPVLLDGIRTPFGRYLGALASVPARALSAAPVTELIRRYPAFQRADGVLLGQVLQAGQGQNPARLIAAEAGVDWRVPALTLNNVCLAGLASSGRLFLAQPSPARVNHTMCGHALARGGLEGAKGGDRKRVPADRKQPGRLAGRLGFI